MVKFLSLVLAAVVLSFHGGDHVHHEHDESLKQGRKVHRLGTIPEGKP